MAPPKVYDFLAGEYAELTNTFGDQPHYDPTLRAGGDDISHPNHYTARGGIEPIDFISSNGLSFAEGNVVKYVYRAPFKGNRLKDLLKARENLDRLIELAPE